MLCVITDIQVYTFYCPNTIKFKWYFDQRLSGCLQFSVEGITFTFIVLHCLHLIKIRDIYKCSWKATSYQYTFTSERLVATNKSFCSHENAGLPYCWTITRKCYNYTCIVVLHFLKLTWPCLYENDINNYKSYVVYLICRLSSV